jgi:ornithine carbamoyltransferase
VEAKHFLSIASQTGADLQTLVKRASMAKRGEIELGDRLAGRQVALIFEKPSTRTRVSFEAAVTSMGGAAIVLRPEEMQLGRGETLEDTGRVLGSYVDAIVLRTSDHRRLERLAEVSGVPVINALSDSEHPCQCLADLLTIQERCGALEGVILAYVGDGNNVAISLMLGACLVGMDIHVATPEGYAPPPAAVTMAESFAERSGASISVGRDPSAAVAGADVVYTDVWTSMGHEEEATQRSDAFSGFIVDESLMSAAGPEAIAMHCLPAHRGQEISAEVIDGPRSAVWYQAANRLHAQRALLDHLLSP